MKGHVGGGPVTDNLWVSDDRSNLKPFQWIHLRGFGFDVGCSYVRNANTPVCDFVQERLPEMPVLLPLIPRGFDRTST